MAHEAYTKAQLEKAERLSYLVPTLQRGRAKATGIEYVIVPSSDDPEHTAHLTNGLFCTCKGHERRGFCSHALAVQMHQSRESERRIAQAQQLRAENGRCKQDGCIMTAIKRGGRCRDHNRALVAALGI